MKKKTPSNSSKDAIASRLAAWRESTLIPCSRVALKLGITCDVLKNTETGKTPLTWAIALKLWEKFALNPQHLATNAGPVILPLDLFRYWLPQVERNAGFSEVYAEHFAPLFAKLEELQVPDSIRNLEEFVRLAKLGQVEPHKIIALASESHRLHPRPIKVRIGAARLSPAPGDAPQTPASAVAS
jgi:hypothetical protein